MPTSAVTIGSPWAPYGLRDDPYFQQALQPRIGDEAARPASLHVGRMTERTLLANQIVGSTSSRAIIQGEAGVGKTSFVSWLKTALAEQEVLTHEAPVRVQAGMGPREFIGEVLKVLLQIRATQAAARGAVVMQGRRSRTASRPESAEEETFWLRLNRLVDGEDSLAGGATLASFGMQQERIRIPAELQTSLFTELEQALAYLSEGRTRRILIHVNNMEGLHGPEARAAADLMQQVRDAFLFDHGHWLFVGTTGIEQDIFRVHPQVGGIVPLSVTLGPLAPTEVRQLLEKRYTHLRNGFRFTLPVASADAEALYARYHGHLRDFLRLLSGAVQRHAVTAPGTSLSAEHVVRTMATSYSAGLTQRITNEDAQALANTLSGQPFHTEFRVTDIERRAGTTQALASRLVARLLEKGVIHESRRRGRSVFYRVSHGDDTVALGLV